MVSILRLVFLEGSYILGVGIVFWNYKNLFLFVFRGDINLNVDVFRG